MSALADDFNEHGADAIMRARIEDPLGYVKVCASLMPKEVELSRPLDDITDEQLAAALATVRAIEAAQNPGGGAEAEVGVQQAQELRSLQEAG